ncbi:MAG: hypothetical protein ACREMA_15560, partial [Longimicrobiales bacterium]
MEKAGAKTAAIAAMAEQVNASLERGLVGSSIDLTGRAGVLADRAAAVQAAVQNKLAGKAGLKLERIGAVNEFYTKVFD